jgi:hypothetical protein
MRNFPTWSSLKHFNHVSTISFADGQSFYDILKVYLILMIGITNRVLNHLAFSLYYHALYSYFLKIRHLYTAFEPISVTG